MVIRGCDTVWQWQSYSNDLFVTCRRTILKYLLIDQLIITVFIICNFVVKTHMSCVPWKRRIRRARSRWWRRWPGRGRLPSESGRLIFYAQLISNCHPSSTKQKCWWCLWRKKTQYWSYTVRRPVSRDILFSFWRSENPLGATSNAISAHLLVVHVKSTSTEGTLHPVALLSSAARH